MTVDELRKQYPNLSDDAIADLAAVSLKISGNKKTRKGFLGLLKEVEPERPIPEVDEVNAVEAKLKEERDAREKFEQEQRNRWLSEDLGRKKNEVREKYSLSDEDMTKMEKMMTDKALPADYAWAAQIYKQQTETAPPTSYGASGYGPLAVKDYMASMEGLIEDPDGWSRKTAHDMIEDIQKRGPGKPW